MKLPFLSLLAASSLATAAVAASPFDGTWRPDPQQPEPGRADDVFQLANGEYRCETCKPPYRIKADGSLHPLTGNERYDSLSVQVTDERHLTKLAKKAGATVISSHVEISADGNTLNEQQIITDAGPRPVDFTTHSTRTAPAAPGAHLISGSWHLLDADLTHHEEDTDYRVVDGFLSMSDRMGRSFKAKLDGTDAPYRGDPQFTTVSVRQIDERTIEETDKHAGKPVKVNRWQVDPDGRRIHAQFDDLHGHIQHQDGHKLP